MPSESSLFPAVSESFSLPASSLAPPGECCPTAGYLAPLTFAGRYYGARAFLQRQGLLPPDGMPSPRTDPYAWKIVRQALHPPLPLPDFQRPLLGEPPPDRGRSFDWPHPKFTP